MITLQHFVVILMVGFSLTALITSMFEMMRTGFNLTLHVVFQFIATILALLTLALMVMNPSSTDSTMVFYGAIGTFVAALLALLIWLGNMFRGLMLFRCMQGSSFHSHVFAHQILLVIISLTAVFTF